MSSYIYVGAQFADFDSLDHCIKEYEKENHVTFYKRDNRTLQNMSRRIIRVNKNDQISEERKKQLKYYSLKYACIYGGRTFKKSTSTLVNPKRKTKTFRQDCPARINVLLSEDQNFLRIVSIHEEHNHVISEEINKKLPKHRKLAKEEEEKVQKLLNLKVNKQLLLEQIRQETGKMVTRKDLNNIAGRSKKKSAQEPLIANQSGITNIIEIDSLDGAIATGSMTAFTPLITTEATLIEGATLSELGATVMEDHMYEEPSLTEIGEIELPRVGSCKEKERLDEQSKLDFLREIESKKLKIEQEKLLLKSTKVRLLEEQNQLIKQLIDKIK